VLLLAFAAALVADSACGSLLNLGAEELVQADGTDIAVNGYSVPSYVDWNNDGRKDLIIGEGGDGYSGKVRVYLNTGTASNPQFSTFSYAQSGGADLVCTASGCLGCFPRVTYWDSDARKDLLMGQSDGTVKIFLNVGTDADPVFDAGATLQVGMPGSELNIDVGARATSTVVDWDNDGLRDLAIGALDGELHIFLNEGTDTDPDYLAETIAQGGDSDLVVPSSRLSPVILDLDGDGKKDLLTGNTNGQLLLYSNVGTNESPLFSGYSQIEADGAAIDLLGTPRSRPFVCDWTGDGYLDVLIGAQDGKIHLFQGTPEPATISLLALGILALRRRRRA
jgi:hypothetical protein